MAAGMAAPSLTLLFSGNSGENSQGLAALTFSGRRRRSYWRLPKSTGVFSGGAAAAVPVAAAVTPAPGGDLSVLIPISVLLLVFYWVSNFVVADMVARDLRQHDDEVSSQDKREDPRF